MTYAERVVQWLRERLDRDPPLSQPQELNMALRVLALWRASAIVDAYVRHHGQVILQGPFAGMSYLRTATEGALAPRLLGTYESELHPHIEAFAQQGFETVIDVGCAEGYYAVGLARLMPAATIYAYDIEAKARAACEALAQTNGVADRVMVGETFAPTGFEAFAGQKCLVLMDVEGAEDDLLRPDLSPAVAGMTLIVETHDVYRPGNLARLVERFSPTHDIVRLDTQPKTLPLPDWLAQSGHLDQLLAVWEWRIKPTPWLVMTPKT